MFARRRPLLRAAVVGGGAYVAGKKMGQRQDQQQTPQEQEQETSQQTGPGAQSQTSVPSQAGPSESSQPSVSDQLAKLSNLHQQGALNDAEFASAKAKLLGS
jgi:hypothetical protein